MFSTVLIFITLLFKIYSQCDNLKFKSQKGTQFNLNGLDNEKTWQVQDEQAGMGIFNMVYKFNFCKTQGIRCDQKGGQMTEVLQVLDELTDNCDLIVPQTQQPIFGLISEDNPNIGVQLTYQGIKACNVKYEVSQQVGQYGNQGAQAITQQSQQTAKATYIVQCSSSQDDSWKVDSKDDCNLKFTIRSPAGCPTGMYGSSTYFSLLLKILFIFGIYVAIGFAYNIKVQQRTGMEAFPHIEFWLQLPQLSKEGVQFVLGQGKQFVNNKMQGNQNSSGYSNV